MFREEPMDEAAARYARYPMRKAFEAKDPRGFAEFEKTLADHSATGLALTMSQVQGQRPTLWDMEEALSRLEVPLLVIVGDEDDPCLDGSVFLKRTAPHGSAGGGPAFGTYADAGRAGGRQPGAGGTFPRCRRGRVDGPPEGAVSSAATATGAVRVSTADGVAELRLCSGRQP